MHPARYPAMLGRPHALVIREEGVTQRDHLGNNQVLQADPPCPSFLLWTGIPELGLRAQQLPKQEGVSSEAGLSAEGHKPAGQPDHLAAGWGWGKMGDEQGNQGSVYRAAPQAGLNEGPYKCPKGGTDSVRK